LTTTFAPSFAKLRQISLPIPQPAPVTAAIFPFNTPMILPLNIFSSLYFILIIYKKNNNIKERLYLI